MKDTSPTEDQFGVFKKIAFDARKVAIERVLRNKINYLPRRAQNELTPVAAIVSCFLRNDLIRLTISTSILLL